MKKIFGNPKGLKANQLRRLENLYRRRVTPEYIISRELCRDLSRLSFEIRRQVGLLINRRGKIICVIVGDSQKIVIPVLYEYRAAPDRLNGLRCVHTHMDRETLTADDLTDLALLRLDLMAAVTLDPTGLPDQVHVAHLLPGVDQTHQMLDPLRVNQLNIGCLQLIRALEAELAQKRSGRQAAVGQERALLVSVTTEARKKARSSLAELEELARSGGVHVLDIVLQMRRKVDSRYFMGFGKLKELTISALQKGATLLVFDQNLNPSQIRSITDMTALKVIDRTQLILDIFAQRAQSREGKLQVELAQLKYLLPRLVTKSTALSRLTGGIGGRGPGETKLEIHRRRARERIRKLERELNTVKKRRRQQRAKRDKRDLPVISIIGYTNAGKSTLLNTLTQSRVLTEDKLFATLDPASRRLRFPRDIEVIITDTVGFIQDLPKELMVAFRATLEELENADLLLHVIDLSNPRFRTQIRSVEQILVDLDLHQIPIIRVLNKQDLVEAEFGSHAAEALDAILISAKTRSSLKPLVKCLADSIARHKPIQ